MATLRQLIASIPSPEAMAPSLQFEREVRRSVEAMQRMVPPPAIMEPQREVLRSIESFNRMLTSPAALIG